MKSSSSSQENISAAITITNDGFTTSSQLTGRPLNIFSVSIAKPSSFSTFPERRTFPNAHAS
jgi:hypothetical protein